MPRRSTIRRQLTWVVVAAALPVWLGSVLLLYQVHVRERALDERNAGATARALSALVDRELARAQTAAEILATSPALLAGDLAAFHERTSAALHAEIGDVVVLSDASGQQLLSTASAYGEALPVHGNPQQVRKVLESGRPSVSGVYAEGAMRTPVVSVDVPVFREGKVVKALSVALLPRRLGELLRAQRLPDGWVASIFDGGGVIVARTDGEDRFVGQKGPPALLEAIARTSEGMVHSEIFDEIPVSSVFSRSPVSNWAVTIGVPTKELTTRLWHSLGISVAITLVLMALGIVAAHWLGERLARPIRALIAPALAHGRGERVELPPLDLAEADDLGRALAEGSRLLQERTIERDRAESAGQQSLAAKKAAEDATHARSAYFAYLSHELRTPLTAILGYSDLIARRAEAKDAKSAGYCARIEQAANHLLKIVNDILDYAKFEADELSLQKELVDVRELVEDALQLLAANAEQAGIHLKQEIAPALPSIRADRMRMRQILLNLVSNALRFTERGGTVSVGAAPGSDRSLVIEVQDTGIGIPPEELPRVLQPFTQVVDPSKPRLVGTGLGLPLAKGLVELHGGTLEIASEPGIGTTVTIRLPLDERR
jgi:signal transduction histidine kinase